MPPAKLEPMAKAAGLTVAQWLLHQMEQHRSVTQVGAETGISAMSISRALKKYGWKRRGTTSNSTWVAPSGQVFSVMKNQYADGLEETPTTAEAVMIEAVDVPAEQPAVTSLKRQAGELIAAMDVPEPEPEPAMARCRLCGRTVAEAAAFSLSGMTCMGCQEQVLIHLVRPALNAAEVQMTDAELVLVVDPVAGRLMKAQLIVLEERELPENGAKLAEIARRDGFTTQYTRGPLNWTKVVKR